MSTAKPAEDLIQVEVAFALPDRQALCELVLPSNATVEDALRQSGLYQQFPDEGLQQAAVGIWGKLASRSDTLATGDRVELYRPLQEDPREARRLRA